MLARRVLTLALFWISLAAQADTLFQVPTRQEKRAYQLVNEGMSAIDLGYRAPSKVYAIGSRAEFDLPAAFDNAETKFFERPGPGEIYSFTQILDEASGDLTVKLEGFAVTTGASVYSGVTYKGQMYGAGPILAVMNAEQSVLYYMDTYANELFALDLESRTASQVLKLPKSPTGTYARMQLLMFDDRPALAFIGESAYQQGSIQILDLATKTFVVKVTGYDFGFRDAEPNTEPFNRDPQVSADGKLAIFCDLDKCARVDLGTRAIINLGLPGDTNTSAKFSADDRFVFAVDGARGRFRVLRVSDAVELASTVLDVGAIDRIVTLPGGLGYLVHAGSMVLSISPAGKIAGQVTSSGHLNWFEDLTFTGVGGAGVEFVTVDAHGTVESQTLPLAP